MPWSPTLPWRSSVEPRAWLALLLALTSLASACQRRSTDTQPQGQSQGQSQGQPQGQPQGQALAPSGAASDAATSLTALEDPQTCAPCHAQVVAEWEQSMHSRAHHERDPIFGAMLAYRSAREGEDLSHKCATCHSPRDTQRLDSVAARAGVSCATCHNLSAVHLEPGRFGVKALERGPEGMMRGAHDVAPGASTMHQTGPALPALQDGTTLCLACHQEHKNKAQVPTCSTGVELSQSPEAASCASCHMPWVESPAGAVNPRPRHRSHAFAGPHRAWLQQDTTLLEGAIATEAKLDQDGLLSVTMTNTSGHSVPTGFPGRVAALHIKAFDAQGAVLWSSFERAPEQEHPEAWLGKVYVDEAGQPTMPPYGVKIAKDTRLSPQQRRTLQIKLPAQATRAELAWMYWLIPPSASQTLKISALPEAAPITLPALQVERAKTQE